MFSRFSGVVPVPRPWYVSKGMVREYFLLGTSLKNAECDADLDAASLIWRCAMLLPGNDQYHSCKTTNGQSVKLDGKKSKFEYE